VKVDNDTTKGRLAQAERIRKLAESTKRRNEGLLGKYEELVLWAQTPLPPEIVARLFGA
jgi:hypothetical protein